jgi:hypothetical protein
MSVMSITADSITLLLLIFQFAYAPHGLGGLGHVLLTGRVRLDLSHGVYTYSYSLSNPSTSTLNIQQFSIDMSQSVERLEKDSIHLTWVDSVTRDRFLREYMGLAGGVTVVSVNAAPAKWIGDLTNWLAVKWFTSRSFAIQPNHSMSGFELQSKGLPSIRNALIEPFFDIDQFPSADDLNSEWAADSLLNAIDSLKRASSCQRKTVGPMAPEATFRPIVLLDSLNSYVTQSHNLGWITTQSAASKYLDRFYKARSQLKSANLTGALTTLQAVLDQVHQDSSSTLTNEAYALIRFNTDYLIKNLNCVQRR